MSGDTAPHGSGRAAGGFSVLTDCDPVSPPRTAPRDGQRRSRVSAACAAALVRAALKPFPSLTLSPFILFSSFLTRGGREGEAGERWSAQIFWQKPHWRRARNDLMTGVRFGSAITLCFPILQGIQICN